MKTNVYDWIIKVQGKDGSVEYSVVMDYSLSLIRTYIRNLRRRNDVWSAHAFKKIDIL